MNLTASFHENRGRSYGVEHLLAHRSGPLDEILQEKLHLTPEKSQFLLDFGAIYLDQRRVLTQSQESPWIESGAYLRVHQNPRRFPTKDLQSLVEIVDNHEDYLVVSKPSGIPVHPTVDNTQENLQVVLENQLQLPLFITHRLDVATQGLILLAKNKESQTLFNQMLMDGLVHKYYRAQVHGVLKLPPELVHYMKPSPRAPKEVSETAYPGWAQCRLRVLDQEQISENQSELCLELLTGRTHQIRAQLAASGLPILGDVAYGSTQTLAPYEKIMLKSCFLSFSWKGQEKAYKLQNVKSKY